MELTAQDKALLETDFGEEIEKLAAERVGACEEAYAYGFAKLAAEAADAKDEDDKKEDKKEDKEEKMDEESEKAAAELGSFIERGFFDGLRKLGAERHNDEMHYLAPFVEEKIAAGMGEAAKALGKEVMSAVKAAPGKAKDLAVKGKDAVVMHNKEMGGNFRQGYEGLRSSIKGTSEYGDALAAADRKGRALGAAKNLGKGALRASPYAAVAGLGAAGVAKAVSGKKDPEAE